MYLTQSCWSVALSIYGSDNLRELHNLPMWSLRPQQFLPRHHQYFPRDSPPNFLSENKRSTLVMTQFICLYDILYINEN